MFVLPRFYNNNNYSDISVVISLLVGCLAGAISANAFSSLMLSCFTNSTGGFYLTAFITTNVSFKTLFAETVRIRLEFFAVLVMISFTRYRQFFFGVYVFVIGLCGGVMISVNTMYFMGTDHFAADYLGTLVYISSIMPHYILYISAVILFYKICIKQETTIKLTAFCTVISVLIIFLGTVCEAWIGPRLIRFIISKLINLN